MSDMNMQAEMVICYDVDELVQDRMMSDKWFQGRLDRVMSGMNMQAEMMICYCYDVDELVQDRMMSDEWFQGQIDDWIWMLEKGGV
ncbi:unnamed protein product [Gordionus sp. m RMFG-2023]